jgi:hypothetical protein
MDKTSVLTLFSQSQSKQFELFKAGLDALDTPAPLPEPDEPERPNPTVPPAESPDRVLNMIDKPIMKTQGEFPKGFPEGAIVHFTAGRFDKGLQSAIDTIEYGASQGFAYWAIAIDGTVVRGHDIRKWGYHAGVSERSPLGKSVSKRLLGIEICCAGKVTRNGDGTFSTWYGTKFPNTSDKIRHTDGKRYPEEEAGYYHKYTVEQEAALVNLLMQLREDSNGIFSFDNVFGHDEVAMPRGRKNDPGGALSVGMPEFRKFLKLEAQARGIK